MKITSQKNVYYIDIGKNIYKGYIETSVITDKEEIMYYKYASMDILSISIILEDGTTVNSEVQKLLLRDFLKNQDSINKDENYAKIYDQQEHEKEMSDVLKISGVPKGNITIRIEFRPSEFNTSILFYKPVYADDKHKEMIAINRSCYSYEIFPSLWTDSPRTGYPWELVYILPNSEEYKIVSPGILKSFNEEEKVNISMYYVEESIPDFINFSVGTFERLEIHNGDDKKVIFVPSNLEEYSDALNDVIEDMANIFKYTEHFLQRSFPIPTLSILFSMIDIEMAMGIGTALCNISLLTPSKDIDPMFDIKRILSSIVSSQVFYFYVHYSEITDFWIFCGLKGYLEDYSVRFLLGNNDFLFTLKEDKDFVFQNDVYELPLCDSRRDFHSYQTEFFQKKSKLVFHTLESNLSKAFLEKICNFTLKKTNSQIGNNFTPDFILLIKDVTGKDMKSFFDTYVFKPGLINVFFKFTIDKKKNRVDFRTEQRPTSKLPDCNKRLNGLITVKSYEVEGSYDHSFNFNQDNHFYYHTRTKKKKKPEEEEEEIMPLLWIRIDPKREHLLNGVVEQPDYMFIEQLLDKNVIGQIEAIEYLSKRPSVQICEAFERILDNSQMFYKIRIRVLYVLAKINIENYVGFQRVIQFFIKKFCVQASTVIKPNDFTYINYFLQKHSIRALSYTDPFIVKNYNGRNVGSASIVCAFMINILRFNDNSMNSFSDSWYIASVIESLVRPILAMKLPGVGDMINLESKSECKKIFYDKDTNQKKDEFLNLEESSSNEDQNVNDYNFLAEESTSSMASIPDRQPEEKTETLNYIDVAVNEIERYRLLDMVFPSHNNIVTESTLYFLGRLAINGCIGIRRDVLISLSSFPNAFSVRKAALTLLLILFPDKESLEFMLGLLKEDIFRIKMVIVEIIEDAISKNLCDIRALLGEVKEILYIFPYDPILRDKMQNINLFVEGKDISNDDYYQKLLEFYNSHHDKEFYYKKTMTQSHSLTADTIRIRLLNFVDMKRESLKKSYVLKLSRGGKELNQINSHGPSRKKTVKKIEEVVKPEVVKQEVVEVKKEEKVIEEKKEEKEDKVVEKIKEEKEEEILTEKGNSIEEVNIKEMLEGDPYTEELLSSCVEKKTVESPFVISKNNTNSVATATLNISSTTQALANDVLNNTQDFNSKEKIVKIPSNQSKSEEIVDEEKVKKAKVIEEKKLEGNEVIKKKEHLEGLFKEMKDTLNRNMGLLRETKANFNYRAIDAEIVSHKKSEAIDLERLLLEDEDDVQPKTLENILEVDLPKQPMIDIDSFLDGGFDAMPPVNIMRETVESNYRLNSVKTSVFSLRLKIGWSIRIKAVDPRTLTSSSSGGDSSSSKKKRGRKPRSNSDILSYESKRVTRAQKIYEETIHGVNVKQFNNLIFKNRETNFFAWIPKTFAEIEDMIFDEIGYSSISKELERSLVFLLSFAAPNTRTYTICKKMFDSFEGVRYLYTPIPQEISEMTPVLRDACVDFLNSLFLDDSFASFIKPVNTDLHKTYIDVVRFPMCLEIIQKKMNVYRSLESFYGDLRQIHKNCCYFNQNSSDICNNARKLMRYVTEFNRQIHGMKVVHKSSEVIKALLSRFSNSSMYDEMIYKVDNRVYKTFSSLFSDVEKVKESYIRVVMSPQQLKHDIDDLKAQIYYWFNVIEGKSICFGI